MVVTKSYGLSLEWIGYSRKDFTFPTDQVKKTLEPLDRPGHASMLSGGGGGGVSSSPSRARMCVCVST